jgi:hypothetical protein
MSQKNPNVTNFYASLDTSLSREQVAEIYRTLGWRVRQSGWQELEIFGPGCELELAASRASGPVR